MSFKSSLLRLISTYSRIAHREPTAPPPHGLNPTYVFLKVYFFIPLFVFETTSLCYYINSISAKETGQCCFQFVLFWSSSFR
jgi:hypothetical protein